MKKVVETMWSQSQRDNVCAGCFQPVQRVFIATGHDRTDEAFALCGCGYGDEFKKAYSKVKNPTEPAEYYRRYLK